MPHDLANDDGYVALKQATEDREGQRVPQREGQTARQKLTERM